MTKHRKAGQKNHGTRVALKGADGDVEVADLLGCSRCRRGEDCPAGRIWKITTRDGHDLRSYH